MVFLSAKNDLSLRWEAQTVIISTRGVRWDQRQDNSFRYNNTKALQLIGENTLTLDQVVYSYRLKNRGNVVAVNLSAEC